MNNSPSTKLTKKDLVKTWWTWICFGQICYNYERLMGLGFCHTMSIIIKKLYKTKEEISEALTRHLNFFNTENTWGSIIVGISTALEEEKANGKEVDPELINNIKTSLMGPMAGIGDSVTQGIVKVVLLAIGVDLALQGNAFGPILFVTLFTVYSAGVSYSLFFSGYRMGKNAVLKLLSSEVTKSLTDGLKIMSMMVVGALASTTIVANVRLEYTINKTILKVQPILDKIFPKMVPLSILLLTFWLLRKKGKSPTFILLVLFILGFAATYLKILS
ncbi:MAG: system mannose/fructose/sorbose family component [Clostridia bacterium]|nr:system mannose/fructose/sorbose family component [Clostridia bacterium]